MSQLINYSELDSEIQNRMSGQAPSTAQRLQALNGVMQWLYSKFDVDSSLRNFIFNVVPDGQPIDISDFVSDFKKPKDLRFANPGSQTSEYQQTEDDLFETHIGNKMKLNEYTVNWNEGKLYLKINSSGGVESQQLFGFGDTDDVTASGDTVDITTTEVTTLGQSQSVRFDVDVSESAEDYALVEVALDNAIDLSDYLNIGKLKFWTYIPNVTNFTSVSLRWGSSSSAYHEGTVTTQADGSPLIAGWNFIEIDWEDATDTGTPDDDNIDYVGVKYNYESSYVDSNKFVIEAINIYQPVPMKMVYFSFFNALTTAGSFQEDLSTTSTDTILVPRRYKELIINKTLQRLWPMSIGADDSGNEISLLKSEEKDLLSSFDLDIGSTPKRPVKKIKLYGTR